MKAPQLQHVTALDLRDTARLLALYDQAVRARRIGKSEAERLTFVALAQHVLCYGPENPGGLFLQLLRRRHFHCITQDEEDGAQQRLKHYLYDGPWSVHHSATDGRREDTKTPVLHTFARGVSVTQGRTTDHRSQG
jgi:hypothetical protein